MEYKKIPMNALWFAKCHYCGASNPVFSEGSLPVTHMEVSDNKFFVCNNCMEKEDIINHECSIPK